MGRVGYVREAFSFKLLKMWLGKGIISGFSFDIIQSMIFVHLQNTGILNVLLKNYYI